jgi:hypothetical protein
MLNFVFKNMLVFVMHDVMVLSWHCAHLFACLCCLGIALIFAMCSSSFKNMLDFVFKKYSHPCDMQCSSL